MGWFYTILMYSLEVGAFGASLIYFKFDHAKPIRFLVWFLGITICVEFIALYTSFVDSFLVFLKDTPFERNYWMYNIYNILSYTFYITFFKWQLVSKNFIRIINYFIICFVGIAVAEAIFSGTFFEAYQPITHICGTLLIFFSIALFYLKILKSDEILSVKENLPFYVSVGALLFHLCVTPFFIYSSYFRNSLDPDFVIIFRRAIFGINIIFYSIYIAGFIICSRKKDPYFKKKSY